MKGAAVFSGAGISGAAPASLPRGFGLRDDVLRVVHAAAQQVVPQVVTDAALVSLIESPRKLEVVLGRLWGTIGSDALQCLLALRIEMPNEAHMLAAVQLALGGVHVTLNFDVGIELAYSLLTGVAQLPATAPPELAEMLGPWQALLPRRPPPLRVVASHREFTAWEADARPPALLKVHGSLSLDQNHLIDVVVVDIDELGQLSAARRSAVDLLRQADRLLITGYSGADPDVYELLLAAAEAPESSWCCYSLDDTSPVRRDVPARGISLRLGAPEGLAVNALREFLDLPDAPPWPELELPGQTYRGRFNRWAAWLCVRHSPRSLTQAWAWLIADLGDLDTAESILGQLTAGANPGSGTLLRHAEILYTRARGDDRDRAATFYRRVASLPTVTSVERNHCRLRASDIARGSAIRDRTNWIGVLVRLMRALAGPIRVLITTRAGRRETESAADAFRALQQTGLRALERLAGSVPTLWWPMLARGCRGLTFFGHRAEALATNGNRRALIRQQRLHLTALAALFAGHAPPPDLQRDLSSLHDTYATADDYPGAANCTVTLAVIAAAQKDIRLARAQLDTARQEYSAGRPDRRPIPSGHALLAAIERIVIRSSTQPAMQSGRHPSGSSAWGSARTPGHFQVLSRTRSRGRGWLGRLRRWRRLGGGGGLRRRTQRWVRRWGRIRCSRA